MKVLHLINTLSTGGAETHLFTLCRYLKRQNLEVVVSCLREQVKGSRSLRLDFEEEGIRVLNLQADSRYDWKFLARFDRVLKEEYPDVLHSHLPRADLAGAYGKFLYPSMIWVSSVHDVYDQSWSGWRTLPLLGFVWRRADTVVAISHAVKNWLVNQRGGRADRIKVIHYGIEAERFCSAVDARTKSQKVAGRGVIGSIGRLEPRKGHDILVEAMRTVSKQVPYASLLIAGHDPWCYGPSLQTRIDRLRLHSRVRLVGFQADVSSFLADLNVFAFASRSEGFGQVVIEAMAAGKPVVASKISPLTEILVDGETGSLVDPRKPEAFAYAISRLLMCPAEAQQMGTRGQERVQRHFSAQKMAQETLMLYDELLRQRSVKRLSA